MLVNLKLRSLKVALPSAAIKKRIPCSKENLIKGITNWLKIVESHYGVKPILYSGAHFYNDNLKENFHDYKLWVANYNKLENPLKSRDWTMWQFSDNGTAAGIKGPVDLDLFNGSLAELQKYALK